MILDPDEFYILVSREAVHVPTLYTGSFRGAGRCLVSEPFDSDDPGWQPVPPGSFVTMTRDSVVVRPFEPAVDEIAIAV